MNALQELRRLLSARAVVRYSADIISLTDSTAEVSTGAGRRTVRRESSVSLRVGDRVVVDSGLVVGKGKPESEVPVYWI